MAPKKEFWQVWHNNIGKVSDEENIQYYIERYYQLVLKKLDPTDILQDLNGYTLLCYENNTEFCHRHIVAAWLELLLNIEVPEVIYEEEAVKRVSRPSYVKEYLEKVMREKNNMYGFHSLRAWYLFKQSEMFEKEAEKYKDLFGEEAYFMDAWTEQKVRAYDWYMQKACYLRCDADEEEFKYLHDQKIRKLEKK